MLAARMRYSALARGIATLVGVAALIGGGVWLSRVWRQHEQDAAHARAQAERRAAEEREQERSARLRRESEALIPDLLEGIYLGMPLAEARRVRPRMTPELSNDNPEARGTTIFDENLPNGARVVYVFTRSPDRLERVQILSMLPSVEAVAAHLAAMNTQYGAPTGIWDCPQTGGVPTRRFTWRHGETTVSDVFLVVGERVSVTLYIAPSAVIERSLRMGSCVPVNDPARIGAFPVAQPSEPAAQP